MSNMSSLNFLLQDQLFEIHKQYPSIFKHEKMSICSKIYYPIAVIDTLIEENNKQPFSPLEQIIIELIRAGHNNIEKLADVIGLPPVFIGDVVRQLEVDRILKQFTLTAKGEDNLNHKIKLAKRMYKKSIQYDALIQEILPNNPILERLLVPMQDTSNAINHFMPHAYIDTVKIKHIYDKSKEMDDNVVSNEIKEIINIKVYFVEVVVLLFNLIPHPFIFFPNAEGKYSDMLSISEANLSFVEESIEGKMIIDRKRYYDIWLSVKQIKDEMKRTLDNHILRRDIKAKLKQQIHICNEEHTLLTDSCVTLVLELYKPFSFNLNTFNAIRSLEWTSNNIPYMFFENDIEYSSFITYSECFDRRVHDVSKLIFQMDYLFDNREKLYRLLCSLLAMKGNNEVSIVELHDMISQVQIEQKRLSKTI